MQKRVAEILNTTNVSQWNHVCGVNNPADIGTQAINVDELKRGEWLTGPAWLKQRENERPEQLNLTGEQVCFRRTKQPNGFLSKG